MKIYVAGIQFTDKNLDHKAKTDAIIQSVDEIQTQAKECMGEDVVTLILCEEYALTPKSIQNPEKKASVNKINTAVKQHHNLLLIPGSFSASESSKDYSAEKLEKKTKKILNAHEQNLKNPEYQFDPQLKRNYETTKKRLDEIKNQNQEYLIQQNSAYVFSSEPDVATIKQKKSYPFFEEFKLPPIAQSIFNVGQEPIINKIRMNNEEFDMSLVLCKEHVIKPSEITNQNLPALEVILSASIITKEANLFGAINVQMDSKTGLSASVNDAHPKSGVISEIKMFAYQHDGNNITNVDEKMATHFNREIDTNKMGFQEYNKKSGLS